ncbi:MAG: DUF429 domain-containing protein [Roseibium sp.]|uniref:DUF429 domain-containing protein n=1 Tax=Roseibium polysiphoniae TaxID=2571221 RepID=UPI0032979D9D
MDNPTYWLGADPGGDKSFGLAWLLENGSYRTERVSCADEAVEMISDRPAGVGVDAPLWWSSGRSSDRVADRWIRQTFKIHPGTVQTANSLRGAALVQGAMFVQRLRERFPDVPVTETHPKAVAIALGGWQSAEVSRLGVRQSASEHERDALMSAIAAREGFTGNWQRDLAQDRNPSEQDPRSYWLAPVNYFWPD